MTIKYLYLDDANQAEIRPFVTSVMRSGKVEIIHEHPAKYLNNMEEFTVTLRQYDGIILDWRLDEYVQSTEGEIRKFNFRAGGLAQEIHSLTSEGSIAPVPIVLWSATQKFKGSFQNDFTAQDLFIAKYTKEEIGESGGQIANELEALAKGYKSIVEGRGTINNLAVLLGCKEKVEYADVRVLDRFSADTFSAHEVANFILEKIIHHPGLLISEELLLSRLGINRNASPGWVEVKKILDPYIYKGPFFEAWPRWWARGIEDDWWFSVIKAESPLSVLSAPERIAMISDVTKIEGLTAQSPLKPGYHDKFYTICEETRSPLDPIDGVIIEEPQPEPWQERRYISLEVALKRRSENFRPHRLEFERLKAIAENQEK
ncbi:MAG TPA: hypothetical protein PK152_02880 [Anaerolineales bacterium]|nr:hypothetical protein [Anaerolineae bacterium]HRJ55784.1 hypothetical protein [Anaerolineales bacterium]HRK88054.1 hypothetical protein [Anaerolineales bacterium]